MRMIIESIWLYRFFRIFIAMVFLYSGFTKIIDPYNFSKIIGAYGLLPESLNFIAAITISLAEVVAAILLVFDIKSGLYSISIMLIGFMAVLSYGIYLGLDADCGCFGPDDPEGHAFSGLKTALKRDFIFLGILIYLFWWRCRVNKFFGLNSDKN